ncbi:MAG: phosphoglucosamine mutase [Caldicoprobacter sp.]|uniref:phosphoglucosamine mutase n=1 Tax=Caldicoprobacter sp. TaxID=2004500 RepID=UPI0039C2B628
MARMFGTDGVRGVANRDLDCHLAFKLGQAGAYVLSKGKKRPKILIGKDTRLSGDMLEAALIAGICSAGADALVVGVMPTAAIAYLTRHYEVDAGVVISASHNPMEYNGIKFFDGNGYKLPDKMEDEIEAIIKGQEQVDIPAPVGDEIGRKVPVPNALQDYVNFLKGTIDVDLSGLKLAVDCANGAAYKVAPMVFSQLGAEVKVINDNPNGVNINYNCGSTHPEGLQRFVIEAGADVGLAFDGDADRLIAVDEKGQLVDGDQIMVICALDMKERGVLKHNTVVATVMSNIGFDIALKKAGCNFIKTKVGDRYVLEEMLQGGYNIGGEQSGHIIFLDYSTTGDGILTALQLLSVMKRNNRRMSELASVMQRFPQVLVNAKVSPEKKDSYMDDPIISEEISRIEAKFKGAGRVLIRPSGTEPLIRVMIEGADHKEIEDSASRLARLIEERLS